MSNSNRYVDVQINNQGLIPQAVPASYPLIVSTNAYQNLSQLIQNYIFGDDLYTFYAAQSAPIYNTLQAMFEQNASPDQIWGVDLETNYTLTLEADGSMDVVVEWLDIDGDNYQVFSTTVANLAALETYLTTNIPTCDFTTVSLVMTVDPKVGTPNQLVRINITNKELDEYTFAGLGAPAVIDAAFDALITLPPTANSFYCLIVEGTLFYPLLLDSNSTKITAQLALANAVEATADQGDLRKVLAIGSNDANITLGSSTADIAYEVKAANLQRTMVGYYNGANMIAAVVSARFGLDGGESDWAFTTLAGIVYEYLTDAQIDVIYDLDSDGNLSPDCKNANYYDNAASRDFFYPGITGSALPFDVTILSDNIARDCRYAQIQLSNNQANAGNPVPYNQQGINMQVSCIRGVLNSYLQRAAPKITPVNSQGDSCIINAPTFAQIQANPALANQFANRVLTGITINYIPAGGINKVGELLTAII